jgi:hypothetical protein
VALVSRISGSGLLLPSKKTTNPSETHIDLVNNNNDDSTASLTDESHASEGEPSSNCWITLIFKVRLGHSISSVAVLYVVYIFV